MLKVEGLKQGGSVNVYFKKIFSSVEASCPERFYVVGIARIESCNLDFWWERHSRPKTLKKAYGTPSSWRISHTSEMKAFYFSQVLLGKHVLQLIAVKKVTLLSKTHKIECII